MVPKHSEDHSSIYGSLDLTGIYGEGHYPAGLVLLDSASPPLLVHAWCSQISKRTRGKASSLSGYTVQIPTCLARFCISANLLNPDLFPVSRKRFLFPLCCPKRHSSYPICFQASQPYLFSVCRHWQESGRAVEFRWLSLLYPVWY